MHRHTRGLAERHEPRHDGVGIAIARRDRLAMHVGGDAAHIVMAGGEHRDRLFLYIDAGEKARQIGNDRQPLVPGIRVEGREEGGGVVLGWGWSAALAVCYALCEW